MYNVCFSNHTHKAYDYSNLVTDSSITTSTTTEYDVGAVLPAAHRKGAGMYAAYGGYFPLPTAGVDGQCIESSYTTFMTSVRDSTCLRVTDDLEVMTEGRYHRPRVSFHTGFLHTPAPPLTQQTPTPVLALNLTPTYHHHEVGV